MPHPPEGMHWRVDSDYWCNNTYMLKVSLLHDKRRFFKEWDSNKVFFSDDPEENARAAIALGKRIMVRWNAQRRSVNGLKGAVLGRGVVGE